jgi:restriction endonuclease S subunit
LEMPLPPLAEQRAIVERWRSAHAQIAAASGRVEKKKAAIDANFLAALGLNAPAQTTQPKCFAVWWEDTEKWGVQQILQFKLRSKKETKFPEVLLSELCKIGSGGTPSRRNINYFGGSIPWVKTTEVVNAEIIKTEETLTDEGLENSSAKIFPKGSLLVAMYGQGATRGRTAKLGIDAATNQACAVLFDIKPQVETDFLWYFLMSQYDAMRALASGNNQPNLNAEMIANLQIALPPLEVQRKLVERVTAARAEIAHERAATAALRQTIAAEVEALILGTQPVKQA